MIWLAALLFTANAQELREDICTNAHYYENLLNQSQAEYVEKHCAEVFKTNAQYIENSNTYFLRNDAKGKISDSEALNVFKCQPIVDHIRTYKSHVRDCIKDCKKKKPKAPKV